MNVNVNGFPDSGAFGVIHDLGHPAYVPIKQQISGAITWRILIKNFVNRCSN